MSHCCPPSINPPQDSKKTHRQHTLLPTCHTRPCCCFCCCRLLQAASPAVQTLLCCYSVPCCCFGKQPTSLAAALSLLISFACSAITQERLSLPCGPVLQGLYHFNETQLLKIMAAPIGQEDWVRWRQLCSGNTSPQRTHHFPMSLDRVAAT